MSLAPGHKLAHYEILEPIGRGGMGEVYRAKDSKLGRDVAIKVLPDEFAQDEERLRRFQREAKVLASLNHPNIASIYGLEQSGDTHYLVLELVAGETLAERIARGPIPVEEALEIATKIAEALTEAHEEGIVHRDLKPANIKLTPDDKIKVLDFGLAKAFVEDGPESDAASSMSPTITRDATRVGVILGTAAYMSPEQAKGKKVDERADLWSFGTVLYEILTRRRAFEGGDVAETLAAVVRAEPDFTALPADTPEALRRLLRRCLEKDPRKRLADSRDAQLELGDALADPRPQTSEPRRSKAGVIAALAGFLGLVVVAFVIGRTLATSPTETLRVTRFTVPLESGQFFTRAATHALAVSPDGASIAYVANNKLHLRALDRFETASIPGVDGPSEIFFSPNGEWIGFFAEGRLQKVAPSGGAPVTLCPALSVHGAFWVDDEIWFGENGRIVRVPDVGAASAEVVIAHEGEWLAFPHLLPGGRVLLYTRAESGATGETDVVAEVLETGERRVLVSGGSDARYLPSGHIVYGQGGAIVALTFDAHSLKVSGAPVELVREVQIVPARRTPGVQYTVSSTGVLAYRSSNRSAVLVWKYRDGEEEPFPADPGIYVAPAISPDGSRVAVADFSDAVPEILVFDTTRGVSQRLTFEKTGEILPLWTPDGRRIVYASARSGVLNLYWKDADGRGNEERLTVDDENVQAPYAITPDGKTVVFMQRSPETSFDIFTLSLSGNHETRPLIASAADERRPAISPNGRFVAYQSDESGRYEIYVSPFPDVDAAKWQVSSDGGSSALWSPRGDELFYRDGVHLYRVVVSTAGPTLEWETPARMWESPLPFDREGTPTYTVAPDGDRFLFLKPSRPNDEFRVVLNWFEELKRLVPTD